MRKLRLLLLVGTVMLEVGCGLPDSFYLAPPAVTVIAQQTGSTSFTFVNPVHDFNHDINVVFQGDEIFYKLYADSSEVDLNAYDPSNPADPSTQLLSKGFWPLCLGTDVVGSRTDPQVGEAGTAGSGSTVAVTIGLSEASPSTYQLNTNTPAEIRRFAPNTSDGTKYKTFASNTSGVPNGDGYVAGDMDFASVTSDPKYNSSTCFAAWYVISYGLTNSSTPSRSSAAYAGFMTIPFN